MAINILTQEATSKLIAKIGRVSNIVQSQIHVAAVSCLAHARDHGDYTLAVRLCDALPRGTRVKALAFWFSNFSSGKLSLSAGKAGWQASLKKDRSDEDFDLIGAEATSFADLTNERDPKTMTLEALLKYLERKANDDEVLSSGEPRIAADARAAASRALAYLKAPASLQSDLAEAA